MTNAITGRPRWYMAVVGSLLLCVFFAAFSSQVLAETKKNKKTPEKVAKAVPSEKKAAEKKVGSETPSAEVAGGSAADAPKADTGSATTGSASGAAAASSTSSAANALGLSGGNSNEPIFITSDTLALDSKKRVFTYSGKVKVVQGDTNIDANIVVGRYDENNVIQEITCQGNVLMTRGETMRAKSNRAVYRLPTQTVVLTESPEVQHNGSILNADKITIFLKDDRSEAEGNVRVKVIKTDKGMIKKP